MVTVLPGATWPSHLTAPPLPTSIRLAARVDDGARHRGRSSIPAADQMAVREMDAALTAAAQVGIVGGDHQGEAVLLPSHG